MDTTTHSILSSNQKEMVFENMSDGIMTINKEGNITYMNSACETMFHASLSTLQGHSFEDTFLGNKKNKAFNKLFLASLRKNTIPEKTTVKYTSDNGSQYFSIDISLVQPTEHTISSKDSFPGMIILIDDVTDTYELHRHEHDCAYIFAGLILCISLYLSLWSLLRFTLHIPLKTSDYTLMIEGMTFLLFLEILFLTSLSMKDIGLIPKLASLKRNLKETFLLSLIGCCGLVLLKLILLLLGYRIKAYFIGGSLHGATVYIFTAFVQEFLARGVIQTSVKSLMRVKYEKQFGIFLTSLLFSLMHLPFGFIFMAGSFLLSIFLGCLFERHENMWGCAFLHWSCGYLAMCLFF